MLHVVFTEDGIPGWIGTEPRDGSEPVERELMFLAEHRRTPKGTWVRRSPVPVPEPTPQEVQAAEEAARLAAEAAREVALRTALSEEADPLFFKWQRGECDREDWLKAVASAKARFPRP